MLTRILRDYINDGSRRLRRVLVFWPQDYLEQARAALQHVFAIPHRIDIAPTFGVTRSTDIFASVFLEDPAGTGSSGGLSVLLCPNSDKPTFVVPLDSIGLIVIAVDTRSMALDPTAGMPTAAADADAGIRSLLPHFVGLGASAAAIHVIADPLSVHITHALLTERGWLQS
jgi:hypothetical protein